MKLFRRISALVLSAAMAASMSISVSAKELVTIDGHKYVSENGEKSLYTGWTKVNGLHRYYKEGKRCLGWHKIGGSYYYLTRYGGRARGFYQIGDTFYEFKENGKYVGKAVSDNVGLLTAKAAYKRIYDYAKVGKDADGNDIYADDFGGFFERTLYLTNDKNLDIYRDLCGDIYKFEYEESDITYNSLLELERYIKTNISAHNGDIWDEIGIYEMEIKDDGYQKKNWLEIIIEGSEEHKSWLYKHLPEKGYPEEMFDVYILTSEEADWDWLYGEDE